MNENRFASFYGKVYCPKRIQKDEVLTRKEKLWRILVVKKEIEKGKLLNLKFLKKSAL